MDPAGTAELLKVASGFGLVGTVAVILGLQFLKTANKREERMNAIADEDRQWRNNIGEKQMVLLNDMLQAIKIGTETNKSISETNARLIVLLEKK